MRPLLTATVVILAIATVYGLSCWIYPMRDCWVCEGHGNHRPKGEKGRRSRISRRCRWCRGSGKRLRIGRRVVNRIRRQQQNAG